VFPVGAPDGVINTDDLFVISNLFGVEEGQPNYNPDYDWDCDGDIDGNEFGQLRVYLGQPAPTCQ
jgi:hypothetical protein